MKYIITKGGITEKYSKNTTRKEGVFINRRNPGTRKKKKKKKQTQTNKLIVGCR